MGVKKDATTNSTNFIFKNTIKKVNEFNYYIHKLFISNKIMSKLFSINSLDAMQHPI